MLRQALVHPIETARTAPLGTSIMAAIVGADTPNIIEFISQPSWSDGTTIAGSILAGALSGGVLIARQLYLREKVERSVAEHGYDERFLERTTPEWCARQTVLTTLRKTEFLDRYKDLCERRRAINQLSWLPHI